MIFCAFVLLLQESFKGIICITKDNISALKMTMSLTGLFGVPVAPVIRAGLRPAREEGMLAWPLRGHASKIRDDS